MSAKAFYADVKTRAAAYGRSPHDIVVLPGISAAIGSTLQEAERVWEELDDLKSAEVGLTRLSARFGGHDFTNVPLDRSLTKKDSRPGNRRSVQEPRRRLYRHDAQGKPDPEAVASELAGARGHFVATGTPEKVANIIEDWFKMGAADGFNIMPPIINHQLTLFGEEVVPILQAAGCSGTCTRAARYVLTSGLRRWSSRRCSLSQPDMNGPADKLLQNLGDAR